MELRELLRKVLTEKDGLTGLEVSEVRESPCTKPGDNYMSVVSVAEVVGTLAGGARPYSGRVFLKRPVENAQFRELYHTEQAFINEAVMYLKVMPLYDVTLPCARCYHADTDLIVLEDLGNAGYAMADRTKGFDLPTAEHIIKALAKFHVASYHATLTIKDNFFKVCRLLKPIATNRSSSSTMLEDNLLRLNTQLQDVPEVKEALDLLKPLENQVFQTMQKLRKAEKIEVLTHGDFWINNILYRAEYDDDPIRVIDLQSCQLTSPGVDVWSFIFTSLAPSVMENHLEQLVQLYSESFIQELTFLDIPLELIPSPSELNEELTSRELYGFLVALMYLPAVTLSPDSVLEVQNVSKTYQKYHDSIANVQFVGLKERFVKLIQICMKRKVFNKIY